MVGTWSLQTAHQLLVERKIVLWPLGNSVAGSSSVKHLSWCQQSQSCRCSCTSLPAATWEVPSIFWDCHWGKTRFLDRAEKNVKTSLPDAEFGKTITEGTHERNEVHPRTRMWVSQRRAALHCPNGDCTWNLGNLGNFLVQSVFPLSLVSFI